MLKLMREESLLSPHRNVKVGRKEHKGKITTDNPNEMWGTDGTKIWTNHDGWIWLFTTIDHWNGECVGYHMAKKGDRFAAMEAVLQGVKRQYGSTKKNVGAGLKMRMDHGSQYRSDYFQGELKYLGIKAFKGTSVNAVKTQFCMDGSINFLSKLYVSDTLRKHMCP